MSTRSMALSLPLAAALLMTQASDASACGGCFHQSEATQVVAHRMIFSVSQSATTLWDQIEYSGDPESFAWVLPIKGQVDVGISSDALFQVLEQTTQVTVLSPDVFCGPPSGGGTGGGFDGAGGGGGGGPGGVTIIDSGVVGPFEMVQLSSQDPQALASWLTSHGYNIPAEIQPVISAYVAESFNFLALKLVPGQGVASMKPVRVTSQGAGAVLPLRMVAAGTGVATAVQLWVLGEGRYEPQNFPSFLIDENDLVWSWDTMSSNYALLREQGWDDSNGYAWLTDFANGVSPGQIAFPLQDQALDQYADENGMNAQQNFDADMAALYGSIALNDLWLTHLVAKLSQPALGTDLVLQASMSQSPVSSTLQVTQTTGADPCGNTGGAGPGGGGPGGGNAGGGNAGGGNAGGAGGINAGGSGGNGTGGAGGAPVDGGTGSCECGVAHGSGPAREAYLGAGLAAALAGLARRRRKG